MGKSYEHSTIMSILKRVDESIKDNYSSAQYMEVWDTLLYNAIEPILRCTNLVEVILSDVIVVLVISLNQTVVQLGPRSIILI